MSAQTPPTRQNYADAVGGAPVGVEASSPAWADAAASGHAGWAGHHSADEILRAAAEWVWMPGGSEHDEGDIHLARYPARFGGGVRGSRVRSCHDARTVVERAVERTREWGESTLTIWTSGSDAPGLDDELRRRGAEHIDTVAVFALPLDAAAISVPSGIESEIVRTMEQVRDVDAINVDVWQQQPLDAEGLQAELDDVRAALADGSGLRVLARIDGEAVSTAGCTIVGGFTRLWGAATLPHARGRGAYRAVLAERLRASGQRGAATALVKGRHATSAPILARCGFTHFGDERAFRLAV
ncbi:GNAT family N-acetyltransferase [Microbacterium sp. XT11]|uniref:GNAT family N-acetyltransferase n=1 Tax=Microbacterium sp. XT11 TaxID=367477 RepID=UPI000B2887BB|nr:GNAT family N-acetyltransferase [Microbacterium sp. XT11]